MKMMVYTIKDLAAQVCNRPFFLRHAGEALRMFTDEINRDAEDNNLFRHADDYELYELGEYEDTDGSFTLHKAPKLMCQGKQVRRPPTALS